MAAVIFLLKKRLVYLYDDDEMMRIRMMIRREQRC